MSAIEGYRWLIGDEAGIWLDKVAADLAGAPPLPAIVRALRTQLSAERTALVLELIELRAKAREKFSRADELFFTRVGMEQATDELLAAYKAQRFSSAHRIADLCCGIGGDAMALAQDHAINLVDSDEVSLLLAKANVERCGGILAGELVANVEPGHVADVDAWHIDPDRRASGQRTSRVELGEPGVETIDSLRSVGIDAGVKLAPAATAPHHWLAECECEWIETRGECRQQVAWFGQLADSPGGNVATLIDPQSEACSFSGQADMPMSVAESLSTYLFDPSPSLVAARLVGALGEAVELSALSTQSLYLTGASQVIHPHLQSFVVEDELPLDIRKLRAYFQARGIGRLEIKKRGVDITPESLRPQLALSGDHAATLVLTRIGTSAWAIVCQRV